MQVFTGRIIQVEDYLEHIANWTAQVRSFIKNICGLALKVVRPHGFTLAGH